MAIRQLQDAKLEFVFLSKYQAGRTLQIVEGEPSFECKIEVKVEGSNMISKKRKLENEARKHHPLNNLANEQKNLIQH